MVAYLRDLNLGLGRAVHGDLYCVAPIQTGCGGDGSRLINSPYNEQGRVHTVATEKRLYLGLRTLLKAINHLSTIIWQLGLKLNYGRYMNV